LAQNGRLRLHVLEKDHQSQNHQEEDQMKILKFVAGLAGVAMVLSSVVQPANAETLSTDAFNADAISSDDKKAVFLINDDGSIDNTSLLHSGERLANGSNSQWTCDGGDDISCFSSKSSAQTQGRSILPVCTDSKDENCVEKLELAGSDGIFHEAKFIGNPDGIRFPAAPKYNYFEASTVSLWEVPEVPSASGTITYSAMVNVGIGFDNKTKKWHSGAVTAAVIPYRESKDPSYRAPFQSTVESNHLGVRGIGIGGHGPECAWTGNEVCGVAQDYAEGTRVRLTTRISDDIGGWFRGRLKSANIAVSKFSSTNNRLVVEGSPVSVPRMAVVKPIAELNATERAFANRNGMAGGWESGLRTWSKASESRTFAYMDYFRKFNDDTAVGINTLWGFGSITNNTGNQCLSDKTRVLGIVSTNAMVYDGGQPAYSGGFLSYKVAGLHYEPDGETTVKGTYDLVMRSDVARCLYRFGKAPLSASVTVTNEKGAKSTASTVVSEKNGWLKMAAYGFTFSKKTIKVKITKKK
jgi:hypothetical protein